MFVGNDTFAISARLIKPFPGQHDKGSKSRTFNYHLTQARCVVKNAFVILSSVFYVLRKPLLVQPNTAALITMTCVLLNKFLRKSKTSNAIYSSVGTCDHKGNGILIEGT